MDKCERSGAGHRLFVAALLCLSFIGAACSSSTGSKPPEPTVTISAPGSCDVVGCVGEGVDTSVGAYTTEVEDLLFPTGAFGLRLVRSYRSDRPTVGWFGRGWATVFETTIRNSASGPVVDAPVGLMPLWQPEAPAQWGVEGSLAVQSVDAGATELVWPTGERWRFNETGAFSSAISPYGQTITLERVGGSPAALRSSQGPVLTFTSEAGRIVEIATGDGRTASFGYDDDRLVTSNAPGLSVRYAYNAEAQMVQLDGPAGRTSIAYDGGVVSGQTTASGHQLVLSLADGVATVQADEMLTYQHDDEGRLTRVTNGEFDVMVRSFDSSGRLVEATDFAQPGDVVVHSLRRVYSGEQLTKETVDGVTSEFDHDDDGRVTRVDRGSSTISFEYGAGALPLPTAMVTDADGRSELTYVDGFVTSMIDATGVTSIIERDEIGNPVSRAVGAGAAWSYEFDAEGNVLTTTSPTGRVWSSEWAPRSLVLSERDPLGRVTTYRYDGAGHLVEQRLPGDVITSYSYNESGRLAVETSPDGLITRYGYDPDGRLAETVMPGERAWRSSVQRRSDGSSVVTVVAPDGTSSESTLDSVGREVQRRFLEADGSVVETQRRTFEFDRLVTVEVRRGVSRSLSTTTFDESARAVSAESTLDGEVVASTTYRYEHGRLAEVSDGDERVAYDYDEAGRLLSITTSTDTWAVTFESGRLASRTHNGESTRITYDLDGRAISFDDGRMATEWQLDDADRPVARRVGAATATFEWSPSDQLTTYTAADGSQWAWAYDPAGRIVAAEEPGEVLTSYEYELGAITRIRTEGGADDRDDRDDRYSYDVRGQLQSARTAAGDLEYTYDASGRVAAVDGKNTERWTYDALGRVIGVDDGDRQFLLAYDGRGRLQRVDGPDGALVASWIGDNLVNATAPDRDELRVSSDGSGRLSGVQWDNDTAVTLDWSVDGSNLVVSDGDEDAAQHYRSIDGVLTSFSTDGLTIDSTQQDSGYLQALTFSKGDDTGQIRFDQVGRPSVLSAGDVTSSFTYDENGRIAAVLAAESGEAPKQSVVTYDDGRHIEGDKQLVEALFDDDGGLRASLPSSLPNPVSAAGGLGQTGVAAPGGSTVLQAPEPRPLDEVEQAIARATPDVITPIGVRDLSRLAERMIVAEVTRRSPAWQVNGDSIVHAPIINPENGSLAEFNPFVDAAPTGLVLGLLSKQVADDSSLFDRALDTIGDIVGGVYHFAKDVVLFVANNPITRFIVTAGASLAVATCTATVACITIAAVAMLVSLADNASSAVSAIYGAVRACAARDLVGCGLSVVAGAVEVAALAGTVGRVTSAFTRTYFAQRLLAAARASSVGIAQASGRVGMAKSELLAVLRMQRVIAREVPVCASGVCARIDLVTRDLLRRVHFIEVKHGAAARFTSNQQLVYPLVSSAGGYLPAGLAGAGPQAVFATIEVQHWGAGVPLALP